MLCGMQALSDTKLCITYSRGNVCSNCTTDWDSATASSCTRGHDCPLTNVSAIVQGKSSACACFHESPHRGQMAPWEHVLPDEVAAAAVRLVPLVWLADCLQQSCLAVGAAGLSLHSRREAASLSLGWVPQGVGGWAGSLATAARLWIHIYIPLHVDPHNAPDGPTPGPQKDSAQPSHTWMTAVPPGLSRRPMACM